MNLFIAVRGLPDSDEDPKCCVNWSRLFSTTKIVDGSEEAKDRSASALWSLATDNAPNKDTIAKLGGIDPLLGLLVNGQTEKSQQCCAGALAALAAKHLDNRQVIVKKLVSLLNSSTNKKMQSPSWKASLVSLICDA